MDGISGLGSINCPVDAWELISPSAALKRVGCLPPFNFFERQPKAWSIMRSQDACFYWDFGKARQFAAKEETPLLRVLPEFMPLSVGLDMLMKEGLENVFARHIKIVIFAALAPKPGLKLVADESTLLTP